MSFSSIGWTLEQILPLSSYDSRESIVPDMTVPSERVHGRKPS